MSTRASLKRANSVSTKTREFKSVCDMVSNTFISDVDSNIRAKSSLSKYKQCQEKKPRVSNRYSLLPLTHHELQEAKHLNSAKRNNDDNNGKLPKKKLGSFIMNRRSIFNGMTCTIDIDTVEKIDQEDKMADSVKTKTELPVKEINTIKLQSIDESKIFTEIKVQPKDEIKKALEIKFQSINDIKNSLEMKFQSKYDTQKITEIKVQRVKWSTDSECSKHQISRNFTVNRSFNSSSKLELLRQHKFGFKNKENEEISSEFKKHVEFSNEKINSTSIVNGGSIKDRLLALKKNGQMDWQKRTSKTNPEDHEGPNNSININDKNVKVPVIDVDLDKFFGISTRSSYEDLQFDDVDFDHFKLSRYDLLVQPRKVKFQHRKHKGSKNPLKAFAKNHNLA